MNAAHMATGGVVFGLDPMLLSTLLLVLTYVVLLTEKVHRTIVQGDVGVADADRLRFVVFRAPRPFQLSLAHPLTGAVSESPFHLRVVNILKDDHLSTSAIGRETAVGMLGKPGFAIPDRHDGSPWHFGIVCVEFQNLRPRGTGVLVRIGQQGGICRQKQAAVGERFRIKNVNFRVVGLPYFVANS